MTKRFSVMANWRLCATDLGTHFYATAKPSERTTGCNVEAINCRLPTFWTCSWNRESWGYTMPLVTKTHLFWDFLFPSIDQKESGATGPGEHRTHGQDRFISFHVCAVVWAQRHLLQHGSLEFPCASSSIATAKRCSGESWDRICVRCAGSYRD